MILNEHKRHKQGQLPGDYSIGGKIAMREKGYLDLNYITASVKTRKRVARSFRNDLQLRAKTQQRQRDKDVIREALRKED